MSIPISMCEAHKAAKGDEKAYQSLLKKVRANIEFGGHTQFDCSCDPPCPQATLQEFQKLNARLANDCKDIKPETGQTGQKGEPGQTPTKRGQPGNGH